jgi:hypothetical protein
MNSQFTYLTQGENALSDYTDKEWQIISTGFIDQNYTKEDWMHFEA